jgi:hypothetical protein
VAVAWFNDLPLKYHEPGAKNALKLLKRVYQDPDLLKEVARLSGLSVGHINFQKAPSLLPLEVMDRAASQGRMTEFLAEVLVDVTASGIHDDLWRLLGNDAPRVHAAALATKADFDRVAVLPSASMYALNGVSGDLQKIVNVLAKFNDTAVFRFELAQREAHVARVDVFGKGEGTGWLVAPDIILTAYHVVSNVRSKWHTVTAQFDYKRIPKLGGLVLAPGRSVRLASDPDPFLAHSGHAAKLVELSEMSADLSLLDFALLRLAEPVGSQGLGPDGQGDEQRGWFKLPTDTHEFHPAEGLFVLGHPQLSGDTEAGPLMLTLALPSAARLTTHKNRVRYSVNTEGGNSGSPVMDQDFSPVALHHAGERGQPAWDVAGHWQGGFNQGIPLHLIVASIREQVTDAATREALGLK